MLVPSATSSVTSAMEWVLVRHRIRPESGAEWPGLGLGPRFCIILATMYLYPPYGVHLTPGATAMYFRHPIAGALGFNRGASHPRNRGLHAVKSAQSLWELM